MQSCLRVRFLQLLGLTKVFPQTVTNFFLKPITIFFQVQHLMGAIMYAGPRLASSPYAYLLDPVLLYIPNFINGLLSGLSRRSFFLNGGQCMPAVIRSVGIVIIRTIYANIVFANTGPLSRRSYSFVTPGVSCFKSDT
jgi:hypothetical protein